MCYLCLPLVLLWKWSLSNTDPDTRKPNSAGGLEVCVCVCLCVYLYLNFIAMQSSYSEMQASEVASLWWSVLTNIYPLGCNPHFCRASYHSILPRSNQNHCSKVCHHWLVSPVLEVNFHQCFSTLALFTLRWDNSVLWGAVLGNVGW